jgi:hypothetical protein
MSYEPEKLADTLRLMRAKSLLDRAQAVRAFTGVPERELETQKLLWELLSGFSLTPLTDEEKSRILAILEIDPETLPQVLQEPPRDLPPASSPARHRQSLPGDVQRELF